MRTILLFLALALFSGSVAGCAQKPAEPGDKVVAKINTYELTKRDFEEETALTASNKYLAGDPQRAKEQLLDELITKKVLLQEAQRRNFDKDRAFMKEIERYWEQALIKLMVRAKMEELARSAASKDPAAMQKAFDDWLRDIRAKADVKIYKESL